MRKKNKRPKKLPKINGIMNLIRALLFVPLYFVFLLWIIADLYFLSKMYILSKSYNTI